MNQKFINGATLLGVAITLFALRNVGGGVNWQWFIMVGASAFFLITSIIEFFSRK
jgi:hypothetical protein